ncbi:related to isoamyl alcohol oxidase [Phialocephala subalpina]|uniref:Related to isoamyl alcohol oxidase n=1 Tax=Phialocephala subalpina TaxID=576137 RepID=A0A1L7XS59_9HELO|nr:related to isoamyl alcohol oxidase [Phialocephala subalpina]
MLSLSYMLVSRLLAALLVLPTMITVRALHPLQLQRHATSNCHYLPEDAGWPSWNQWGSLNQSVGGRLIAGKPLASVCYGHEANAAACTALQADWTEELIYFTDPIAVMSPKFLNDSCTPFIATATASNSSACALGNLPNYAINVSSAEDLVAGFKFAKDNNIRLVVKNTGHDFLGRSSGQGSLSLWTHNLKDITFLNYTSEGYKGPAVRLGAGVQAYEAYAAVASKDLRITGGLCPTVGLAGGYITGGGHGPLMGSYGLAADNSLEFEVVTPDKGYLVASPSKNADLFWALNGGGGSAYAVILSHTTRAHADGPVAGATVSINNTDETTYWAAVDAWHSLLPALNSVPGAASSFEITEASFFALITVLDGSTTEVTDTLAPFLAQLDQLNVSYASVITYDPTYYAHFSESVSNLPYGPFPTNNLVGGRIIPLSVVSTEDQRSKLIAALRTILGSNTTSWGISGNAANLSVSHTGLDTARLPAWSKMAYTLQINAFPDRDASVDLLNNANAEIIAGQDVLRSLTPGGGTYINEATADPAYWKDDFYGINYQRLLAVKETYDSGVILYGPGVVRSDYWTVASDGRLCKV